MIRKVINGHDIHVNGQQLRIVHQNELAGTVAGFNNIDLLLNEPRGSKYVNLIIHDSELNFELYATSVLDNKDILLKSFIRSLLERGTINHDDEYVLRENGDTYIYARASLDFEKVHEVAGSDGVYTVNGKDINVEAVDFELSIENITEIKKYVTAHEGFNGYLVLINQDRHVTINEEKVILAYPVSEAVSVLNRIHGLENITALNRGRVKISKRRYTFKQYLVSNSQFYIDDSDIYKKGFIIR